MKTELSDWIIVDGYCATRIVKGTDVNHVKNRIAVIIKSGRIRVSPYVNYHYDYKNWQSVCGGSGGSNAKEEGCYGYDLETRAKVDNKLKEMGYII